MHSMRMYSGRLNSYASPTMHLYLVYVTFCVIQGDKKFGVRLFRKH